MFKDGKPVTSADDAGSTFPIPGSQSEWDNARASDELFEDILDIEGPLRVSMAAVAGFSVPGIEDLDSGLLLLEGRIPEDALARLHADAASLRAAADAQDAAGVRAAQGAIVDHLSRLRGLVD